MASDGLNSVHLFGNLGADPELRFTTDGKGVLNLRLATNESWLDGTERKERTEWHAIVIWGKRAEALAKILHKGSQLFIDGSLRTSEYEDRDKVKRRKTEIIASNVILAGARPAPADGPPMATRTMGPNDRPASPGRAAPAHTYEPDPTGGDNDIPF